MNKQSFEAEIKQEQKQSQEWWASLSKQERFQRMLQRDDEFLWLQSLRNDETS